MHGQLGLELPDPPPRRPQLLPHFEPVMMIGVGIMVGVIIISMYLPMFKMPTLVP